MIPSEILDALRTAGCTTYLKDGLLKIRGGNLASPDLRIACTANLEAIQAIVKAEIDEAQSRFDAGLPVLVKLPHIGRTLALCRDDSEIAEYKGEYQGHVLWRRSAFERCIKPNMTDDDRFLMEVLDTFGGSEVVE